MAEKLVAVINPDGTYVGSGAPSGTQNVAITGQPISTTISGSVSTTEVAPAGLSNAYGFTLVDAPGVVTANNFLSVFNPLGSGKNLYLIQSVVSRYSIAGASSPNSLQILRITAASAGTLQAASTIYKGNTANANTVAEVRTGNPTVTTAALAVAYGPPTGTNSTPRSDQIIGSTALPNTLAPGEGIVYRTAAGDVDQIWNISQYWVEASI